MDDEERESRRSSRRRVRDRDLRSRERFWVERPADLVALPTPNRSPVASFNDATKLVIVTAVALAVLRIRGWLVLLLVGLLLVVFAYYNRRGSCACDAEAERAPPSGTLRDSPTEETSYDECKVAMERRPAAIRVASAVSRAEVEPFSHLQLTPRLTAPRERAPVSMEQQRRHYEEYRSDIRRERDWYESVTFADDASRQEHSNRAHARGAPGEEEAEVYTISNAVAPSPRPVTAPRLPSSSGGDRFTRPGTSRTASGWIHPTQPSTSTPSPAASDHLEHYYQSMDDEREAKEHALSVEDESLASSIYG
jgi:hypothetical protein